VIRALIYDDTPALLNSLMKDRDIGPDEIFYIGFHFMEEGDEMRPFAKALLEHLIKKYPKSKLAGPARQKLDLHLTPPPAPEGTKRGARSRSTAAAPPSAAPAAAPKAGAVPGKAVPSAPPPPPVPRGGGRRGRPGRREPCLPPPLRSPPRAGPGRAGEVGKHRFPSQGPEAPGRKARREAVAEARPQGQVQALSLPPRCLPPPRPPEGRRCLPFPDPEWPFPAPARVSLPGSYCPIENFLDFNHQI
jgi:hypothetical protein